MVLQSLVKYYEILSEDDKADIPKQGYCKANVSYALVISTDGELVDVMPMKVPDSKGKKLVPQPMEVPEQVKRAVNISPNFLCDNSSYVLGFDNKGKPQRTKECFDAFCELHKTVLEGADCDEAKAVLSFLVKWDTKAAAENILFADFIDEIYKGANFIFKLDGAFDFVHQNSIIKKAWERHKASMLTDGVRGRCMITGEEAAVARLHPVIKGIKGGQAMGNSLVSFNAPAYESYNKEQGMNSPVSEYAAFAYGTVLNRLLSDASHRISLGDTTIVFWAQSPQSSLYQDVFSMLNEPDELKTLGTDKQRFVRDDEAVRTVRNIFLKIAEGRRIGCDYEADENTRFFILGLSPNAARISVRFFLSNTFGEILKRYEEHYRNLTIEKQIDDEPDALSVWRILNETVSPSSTDKSSSPLLAGSFMRSVLTGQPYPAALFNSVMLRIRAEKDINYCKAAIIKAYLLRSSSDNKYKEVLTVSLNTISDNRAYVLGRLFAALEQAQKNASTSALNTTIKDKYFTAACANPAIAFPVLLRLSSHHIAKAEHGWRDDERIGEIMQLLDVENKPFPKSLSLEEQGIFVLGYYHQKNKIISEIKEAAEAKKIKKQEEE